ncbi:MAG: GNAT family N-acetyltransferase [Pseudomonadota bacterium]|mgnify:CR=1 FL=1|jgi:ribosomal protein S18 acetylase RimI-like enzyme|nr:GNAT family N-acetyltransferase [Pseudomonadota bacterium]MEC8956406.1 GNAT family N-acetyltransferase [Pseudomonadota bacterium]
MKKIIRNAKLNDIETIAKYNIAMALETENKSLDKDTITKGVTSVVMDKSKGLYWVVEIDGTLAGQLMVTYEWSDWRNGMMWWIQSVFVPEGYRRQGVYKTLYRNLVELAKTDKECCGIRLYVEKQNTRAQDTYLNLGMKNAGYEIMEITTR